MKLLIIEDERDLAETLKNGLQAEGFAIDVSYSGGNGYLKIAQFPYDLILLDLMLPDLDGVTLLKRIRKDGNKTPVLILSAKSQLDDIIGGLQSGSDDYMTKPFSFDELLARINALIRRSKELTPTITVGDLTLDIVKKQVKRAGTIIDLTKTEYEILYVLCSRVGSYFSETDLLHSVWDSEYEGMSNVVRVHIKNIRAKLEKAFSGSTPLIHSTKGLGYKIAYEPTEH